MKIFWIILVVSLDILLSMLHYPENWKTIRPGETAEEVHKRLSSNQTALHEAKGDFYEAIYGPIHWPLQVVYNAENRVEAAHVVLFLDTRHVFKRFHITDLSK